MSVVDGLPFAEEKKKYILERLDPILEEMVSELLTEMPKVPLDFMISWLRRRSGMPATSENCSTAQKNKNLKKELNHVTGALEEAGTCIAGKDDENKDADDEEDDDDECDEIPESFKKAENQMGKARQSVSAEAYGVWNQKKAFTPPSYPKTDEQKDRLRKTLMKSFMFNELESQDLETILMAMEEKQFEAGKKVIEEGADGDFLFVIENGQLDCIKGDKVVKTCSPGDVFGELALLYNCPRAASVVAKDASVCWQLDRDSFGHIVKDAAVKRRNKYDTFLKNVALLSSIEAYERSQIADALKAEIFKKGDFIVRQDEPGDKFYIVEEGALYAVKTTGGQENRVMDYKSGDYFGELALLKNQPRAASVAVASDEAKVLSMSRVAFIKMLGPLQSILERKVGSYK